MRRALLWCVGALIAVACVVAPNSGQAWAQMPTFAERVAQRCKGEASWAIALCACVVRNRVEAGADEAHVLDAFFAHDLPATAAEIDLARRVLVGLWPCDPRLWYMFGGVDVARLGLEPAAALVVTERCNWWALFYGKDALE